ncbi:MAG: glycosyltransferase, partial [Allobaculum sp.]|nr:glycosyltransferase [Allobaculum sp.]
MAIKVSVTVPVYNTSKYLRKCLDSLKNQQLEDIEFILVDDGSTDGSGQICDDYAAQDSRFKVIHQANGGLAAARQKGLDVASGKYVIVCDSDDWVEESIYKKLYEAAEKSCADIVICNYYMDYGNGERVKSGDGLYNAQNGYVDNREVLRKGTRSSWSKLIRRDLFGRANVEYQLGINLGEDALIMFKLMLANPKVVCIEDHLYHYRRLYGESTYTNQLKFSHIKQLSYIYTWLQENYSSADYRDILRQRALDIAFAALRASDCPDRYLKDFIKSELPWQKLLQGKPTLKVAMVGVEKIFPLSVARLLLKTLY